MKKNLNDLINEALDAFYEKIDMWPGEDDEIRDLLKHFDLVEAWDMYVADRGR